MFADVEADIYVLADGDGSYDPADAPSLVNTLVTEHVDMAIGTRSGPATGGYPVPGGAGRTFEWLYRRSFPTFSFDIASGYRAFTRRFVKSFPAIPSGFDIGTELSMHASQLMIPVAEIALSDAAGTTDTTSGPRFRIADALRAVANVAILLKETRPFALLSVLAILFWSAGLLLVAPAFAAGLAGNLGFLSHAVLGMALFVAGFVLAGCGLILEAVGRARIEQKRILFLAVPGLRAQ
jgi:hypothetical protein